MNVSQLTRQQIAYRAVLCMRLVPVVLFAIVVLLAVQGTN
jgi:hypothetical protein